MNRLPRMGRWQKHDHFAEQKSAVNGKARGTGNSSMLPDTLQHGFQPSNSSQSIVSRKSQRVVMRKVTLLASTGQ